MTSTHDVAKLAGVFPLTVSRVTNGTVRMGDKKRQKVERAISEAGPKPNKVVRSLYKRSSKITGILVPNTINPFSNELAGVVEEECDCRGCCLTLCNSNDDLEKEKRDLNLLGRTNADGVTLMVSMDETYKKVGNCRIPVVMIDRQIEGDKKITCIQSNHYQGGRMSMEHLLKCGCRYIVQMSDPLHLSSARKRHQGYLDVCGEQGVEPTYIERNYSSESRTEMAERLLEKHPDTGGIIAANDVVVTPVYRELHRKGIGMPEDAQLIGSDNISLNSLFMSEITTIIQFIKKMGQDMAWMLTGCIAGAQISRDKVFNVKLIKRNITLQGMSAVQYQDTPRHQRGKIKCKVEKGEL